MSWLSVMVIQKLVVLGSLKWKMNSKLAEEVAMWADNQLCEGLGFALLQAHLCNNTVGGRGSLLFTDVAYMFCLLKLQLSFGNGCNK